MSDLSKHFNRTEFACKCGCGFDTVDAELITVLELVRSAFGPVNITSGSRCKAHNKAVGGKKKSQHLRGRAADFATTRYPHTVYAWLDQQNPDSLGIGKYDTFTHIDTRAKRARW